MFWMSECESEKKILPNSFEFERYFFPIVLFIKYQEYSKLSYRMSSCQNKIPIIGNLLIRATGDMLANFDERKLSISIQTR